MEELPEMMREKNSMPDMDESSDISSKMEKLKKIDALLSQASSLLKQCLSSDEEKSDEGEVEKEY